MSSMNYSGSPIIFTDLDGTLLDHDDYSFTAAQQALNTIAEKSIPLIINTSKTATEIIHLQKQLTIKQPFICENGAAVYLPPKHGDQGNIENYHCEAFARPRQEILDVLHRLRAEQGYQFTGFADCDAPAISDLTGLDLKQSALALERNFSEPLLWQGSQNSRQHFIEQLQQHQLIAQQGGRFITVSSAVNKAEAMAWFCKFYGGSQCVIALGDSPNDEAMLNAADIAVVIPSKHSGHLDISGAKQVIKTELAGPAGWQAAMDRLLPLFSTIQSSIQMASIE